MLPFRQPLKEVLLILARTENVHHGTDVAHKILGATEHIDSHARQRVREDLLLDWQRVLILELFARCQGSDNSRVLLDSPQTLQLVDAGHRGILGIA